MVEVSEHPEDRGGDIPHAIKRKHDISEQCSETHEAEVEVEEEDHESTQSLKKLSKISLPIFL
jgi:hypothetical protein